VLSLFGWFTSSVRSGSGIAHDHRVGIRRFGISLILITLCSQLAIAQEPVSRPRSFDAPSTAVSDRLRELAERLRPVRERLREDDRVRAAGSLVGLGVVAYEALQRRPQVPLAFVGTQALRLGLHRQLSAIQSRSRFVVEPSISQRGFAVTFRRSFE
jgi:hypothetical protein